MLPRRGLVNQRPLPVRLEAAHHEAEVFSIRERGQKVVSSGVSTDNGAAYNLAGFKKVRQRKKTVIWSVSFI
jgi:hypothetical protein